MFESDSLITDELISWMNSHWAMHMGAVDGHDIRFIASLLQEAQPTNLVEVGCASGLSTGALVMMLKELGNTAKLNSFDIATQFYADSSKELGYLLKQVEQGEKVEAAIYPKTTSLDVASVLESKQIDFCFIDANHSQPWPIIDTLAILPHMKPGSYIVHHDLKMYHDPRKDEFATGPKTVLDQTPNDLCVWFDMRVNTANETGLVTRGIVGNIFAIKVPENTEGLVWSLAQGLYLPWDPIFNTYIEPAMAKRIEHFFSEEYSPAVSEAFEISKLRYNDEIGRKFDLLPNGNSSLPTKIARRAAALLSR
ncbi:class I SAM-dependent methyltransferase [Pseudophaeobacter sp.]|uniref:class I SAM-dependent methyltransferase n=1 Tax=Pseudophaeobacter sp. TaxID=1971739 RepID=UPI0032983AA6